MNINLRQARRLERELSTAQQKQVTQLNEHNIRVSIHQEFDEAVSNAKAKVSAALASANDLVAVRFAIRKAIETKNETAGINKLMNEEALLKEQIKLLEATTVHTFTEDERKVAAARHNAMRVNGPTTTTYGQTIDYIELDGRVVEDEQVRKAIVASQRRVAKIAEELGYLNTSTLIELDANTVQLLELHDIVV